MSQFELMGQTDMDAVTDYSSVSSNLSYDCPVYHEIPGGGVYDPGFNAGGPSAPAPDVVDDPRVALALDQLQQAIDVGPGGIDSQSFFGIPWPWIAGGLLIAIIVRR